MSSKGIKGFNDTQDYSIGVDEWDITFSRGEVES